MDVRSKQVSFFLFLRLQDAFSASSPPQPPKGICAALQRPFGGWGGGMRVGDIAPPPPSLHPINSPAGGWFSGGSGVVQGGPPPPSLHPISSPAGGWFRGGSGLVQGGFRGHPLPPSLHPISSPAGAMRTASLLHCIGPFKAPIRTASFVHSRTVPTLKNRSCTP